MVKKVPKPRIDTGKNKGIGGKRSKASGTYFEREVQKHFNKQDTVVIAKRIVGSGAFGSITRDAKLFGDVHIDYKVLDRPIIAECKFGYGGPTQITLKREWIDKINWEAELAEKYPALIVKFKGSRGPTSRLIIFTWDTWNEMIDKLTEELEFLSRGYIDNGRDEEPFGI